MQKPFAFLSAAFLVLVGLVVLPTPGVGASHHSSSLFGIYFDDPTVTATSPKGATDKVKSICPGTCNAWLPSGHISFPAMADNGLGAIAYSPTSDLMFTVWLSAVGAEVPLRGMSFIISNEKTGAGNYGTFTDDRLIRDGAGEVIVLTEEPQRISLPFKRVGGFPKDAQLGLRIQPMTVGNDTAGVDVMLHYGSAAHPSGVYFTINQPVPAAKVVGGGLLRLQLAETGFKSTLPTTRGNAKSRDVAGAPDDYVKTAWLATPVKAGQPATFATDAMLNVTFAYPGLANDAALLIDVAVNLKIKEQVVSAFAQFGNPAVGANPLPVLSNCANAACITTNYLSIALPTKGLKINATDDLQLEFLVKATSVKDLDHKVLFDAIDAPSGLIAAIQEGADGSGGGSSSSSSSATTTSATSATTTTSDANTTSTAATTTTTTATSNATNETDSAGGAKDVGNPAQVLPNVTFAVAVAAAAMALAWVGRRRSL